MDSETVSAYGAAMETNQTEKPIIPCVFQLCSALATRRWRLRPNCPTPHFDPAR